MFSHTQDVAIWPAPPRHKIGGASNSLNTYSRRWIRILINPHFPGKGGNI